MEERKKPKWLVCGYLWGSKIPKEMVFVYSANELVELLQAWEISKSYDIELYEPKYLGNYE